ncbi:fungal specific transcription factor factor [Fusarium denticulatum]|uniref:Fungal specific transcription factor factor n=1 Tax=Fusarium denticulatum TaxID=48507 RepID=A0A8H5UGP0_9HYPO|nr:fungal specific transcription factor factor [Fusarium denticulatum]
MYLPLYPDDSEPPTSTRHLSELGPCGWDLTEHGQAELMQATLAYRYPTYPEQVAEERLQKTVDILLRERGCTLEDLLEDQVFELFPLVRYGCMGEYAYEDRGLSEPGLILAILLVTTPPCDHMACLKRERLYVTILAMLPILQSELGCSNGVIRTQALVAVYEYGQGLYYRSHLNLSSAICMASRIELPQSIGLELPLELRLSLMLLDCSRESTWRLLKHVLCSYSDDEQDELHLESLISLMPSMNSLCIIANDPEDVSTVEEIAAVMPYIRYAAKRWAGITTYSKPDVMSNSTMAPRFRGDGKASVSCTRCINRKQTCDRALPSCSRCASNPASCEYRQSTEPLTSAAGIDKSQPSPTDCFLFLGRCGWDLTKSGQAQLTEAMLAYDPNDLVAKAGLGDNVMGVFRDRGCTLQELLKDPVFEALPIMEHLRTTGSLHRSELVDSSLPILHLAVLLVATPPCDHKACSQTKRLYVAVKTLFALMQLHLPNHAELLQTQGLIVLYECGHGMLEHAHVTLNSAFTMAARLDVDLSSILTSLEWRLSLMLIDSLVALQTLHRKHNWIPLACPPDHDMVRAIKHNFTVLKTPSGTPRPESASQRVLELGNIVFQCGRILQHVHDSKRDPRTANPHCELIVEIENSIPPFGEDTKHLDLDLSLRLPTRNEEEKQEMASCGRICQSDLRRTSANAAV